MAQPAHPAPSPYGPDRRAIAPAEEQRWGTVAHIVPLVAMALSAGFLGFVGSLIVYLLYKDRGPFVRQHAANSLNIQIWTFIWLVVSVILMLFLIGFVTYPIVLVWSFVVHIIGAVKASRGEWYRPSLVPSFVR